MFKNRVFRRIFGPKTDEVTGEWRKLHNGELSDLYCSLNIICLININIRTSSFNYLGCELSLDGEPDFDKN